MMGIVLAVARVAMGMLWLDNQDWKKPPSFRCASAETNYLYNGTGKGLSYWMHEMVEYSRFGPHATFVEEVALPHCRAFGWVTLGIEGGAGVLLLLGAFTRFAALLSLLQSVNLWIGLSKAPNEWTWSYLLMIVLSLVLLGTAAGRYVGIDALLHERFQRARGRLAAVGALAT
jgi:uncharacterized membrane protein YphA (DoxX/SURF4 family)